MLSNCVKILMMILKDVDIEEYTLLLLYGRDGSTKS